MPRRCPRHLRWGLPRRSQTLGIGKRIGVALTVFQHLRQNVIGCAVQDAGNLGDFVRAQAAGEGIENRNAARDRCFKEDIHAVRLSQREQLEPVLGNELLVGSDDVLARLERTRNKIERHGAAADGFDHEINFGVLLDGRKIGDKVRRKRTVLLGGSGVDCLEDDFLARVFSSSAAFSAESLPRRRRPRRVRQLQYAS